MRSNQACPACAGREIVHASEVLDRDQGRYPMAIRQPSVWRARVTGKFELYLCRTCGLVEWYANTADLEVDGEVLRLLDRAEGPAGGYR